MTLLLSVTISLVAAPSASLADGFEDHVLRTALPPNTTMNMFDYWLIDRLAVDYSWNNLPGYRDQGINAGHNLRFVYSTRGEGAPNTGFFGGPLMGIVGNTLDENGYPTLSATYGGESLAYLFDMSNEASGQPGKATYPGVSGLFRVDDEGYYYYDSRHEFASLDAATHHVNVYDTWAVKASPLLRSNHDGQFFPLDRPTTVFDLVDGALAQKDVTPTSTNLDPATSNSGSLNHWFGMTLTSALYQHDDGTSNGNPITYEITGDDDVWVFIDGVLVADMGGIHGARSIRVDLQTGYVRVFQDSNGDGVWQSNETLYNKAKGETLRECFKLAGREDSVTWRGETFSDGTEHTLKLFYLERGSAASNLKIRFNAMTDPDPAPGASLRLVKRLSGADIKDGLFSASLTPVASETATAAEAAEKVGGPDAQVGEKNVSFPAATRGQDGTATAVADLTFADGFDASDVGKTFLYDVREVVPDSVPAGYTYDTSVYRLAVLVGRVSGVITVSERLSDASGEVVAESTYTNEAESHQEPVAVTFENAYSPKPTGIVLHAAKVLSGRDLAAGEFTFELSENGIVIDTASNAEDGSITFSPITYDRPGEHDYVITEVPGSEEGLTYDSAAYTVHVSVTDDTNVGSLVTAWSYGKAGAPVFHNSFVPPVVDEPADEGAPTDGKPKPAEPAEPAAAASSAIVPDTGDATAPATAALLAILGAAATTSAVLTGRKRL